MSQTIKKFRDENFPNKKFLLQKNWGIAASAEQLSQPVLSMELFISDLKIQRVTKKRSKDFSKSTTIFCKQQVIVAQAQKFSNAEFLDWTIWELAR